MPKSVVANVYLASATSFRTWQYNNNTLNYGGVGGEVLQFNDVVSSLFYHHYFPINSLFDFSPIILLNFSMLLSRTIKILSEFSTNYVILCLGKCVYIHFFSESNSKNTVPTHLFKCYTCLKSVCVKTVLAKKPFKGQWFKIFT